MEEQPVIQKQNPQNLTNPSSIARVGSDQNLINRVTITSKVMPVGFWKSIVIDLFAVLFAGGFGYSFASYLGGGLSPWIVFAVFLGWSTMCVLEGFLEKDGKRMFLIAFVESIAVAIFFWTYPWQTPAIGGLLLLFFLMWGYYAVRRELRDTIEVRFFTATSKVIGKLATGVVIFMAVIYASLAMTSGNFLSRDGFDALFDWSAGVINNVYTNVPLEGSFNDFAQAVAHAEFQGNTTFENLSPADQNTAIAEAVQQMGDDFLVSTSTAAAVSLPTKTVFYNYFSAQLTGLSQKFNNSFIFWWAFGLFLLLRSAAILAVWVAQIVAVIFYELLLAAGFMKVTEESQTKEIVGY